MSPWWPLRGLGWFIVRPRLWLRPLVAHALALSALLAAGLLTGWATWPSELSWGHFSWGHWLWRAGAAISLALAAALATWAVLVPLLLAVVLDTLATAVFAARGHQPAAVPLPTSLAAGLAVLGRTLPLRLRWLAVGLAAVVLGPLGPFVAAYALARIAVVDACDIALAVRGVSAAERLAWYHHERGALRWAALVAGGLQLALGLTLLGWLFWMPGLVCGAALAATDGKELPSPNGNGGTAARITDHL